LLIALLASFSVASKANRLLSQALARDPAVLRARLRVPR
jgi:hypothetical protein